MSLFYAVLGTMIVGLLMIVGVAHLLSLSPFWILFANFVGVIVLAMALDTSNSKNNFKRFKGFKQNK